MSETRYRLIAACLVEGTRLPEELDSALDETPLLRSILAANDKLNLRDVQLRLPRKHAKTLPKGKDREDQVRRREA